MDSAPAYVNTTLLSAPTPAESMQRFIETEDFSLLEKPITFDRDLQQFNKLLCCQAAFGNLATTCLAWPCIPIAMCCPYKFTNEFSLRLDKDAVTSTSAGNDCCCHIAKTLKTVPLEKIQDVELQSSCLLSCFGLKSVNIQTAGQGGSPAPEVSAAFLQNPDKVREAIQLAVRLYRQRALPGGAAGAYAPPRAAWGEISGAGGGGRVGAGGGVLLQRLQNLEGLASRGVLSRTEADELKVCVLAAAEESWLSRLGEAADLKERGLITEKEFVQLKASLIAQLKSSAA